jgi:hypothetical protein
MKTLMIGLSLLVALFDLSGCGSSTDSGDGADSTSTPLSCNDTENHTCIDYGSVELDEQAITCDGATEVPKCAITELRASCTWTDIGGTNVMRWYTDSTETDVEIKNDCDDLTGTLTTS